MNCWDPIGPGMTILFWGLYGDNGKENGNYYTGFYRVLGSIFIGL